MSPLLLAVISGQLWYAVPLICTVSLVYAATRHEYMGPILMHALRFGGWVLGIMVVIMGLMMFMSSFV